MHGYLQSKTLLCMYTPWALQWMNRLYYNSCARDQNNRCKLFPFFRPSLLVRECNLFLAKQCTHPRQSGMTDKYTGQRKKITRRKKVRGYIENLSEGERGREKWSFVRFCAGISIHGSLCWGIDFFVYLALFTSVLFSENVWLIFTGLHFY